jgi:hypothetical protein
MGLFLVAARVLHAPSQAVAFPANSFYVELFLCCCCLCFLGQSALCAF